LNKPGHLLLLHRVSDEQQIHQVLIRIATIQKMKRINIIAY
jgi:hypothetical protein